MRRGTETFSLSLQTLQQLSYHGFLLPSPYQMLYAEADFQPQHETNPSAFVVQVLPVLALAGCSVAFPSAAHAQLYFLQPFVITVFPSGAAPYPGQLPQNPETVFPANHLLKELVLPSKPVAEQTYCYSQHP